MNDYEKKLYTIIGQKLRDARKANKYSLEDAANKLGVIAKTVQRYEIGERKISLNSLRELTNMYGVDYRQLINEAERTLQGENTPDSLERDEDVMYIAGEIGAKEELLALFYAVKDFSADDLNAITYIANRMKNKEE